MTLATTLTVTGPKMVKLSEDHLKKIMLKYLLIMKDVLKVCFAIGDIVSKIL